MIAIYGLLGPSGAGDATFVTIGAAATVAVLGGIRLTRPAVRKAWLAVAAALALLTLGNLVTVVARMPGMAEVRSLADVLFFGAYVPLFVAAYRFGRGTHRSDRTVFLDTGIVGLAGLPIVWELVVEPNLPGPIAGYGVAIALAIPVIDLLLVSLAVPLLLLRSSRTPSAFLFVTALAVMGAGDTIYAVQSLHPTTAQDTLANLCWLASYVLLGGAALVPSARELGAVRDPRRESGDLARLVVTAIAVLATPLVILHESLDDADPELVLFAVLSVCIATILVLRLQRTIGELAQVDRRFRRFMAHPSFMAVIKDAAGRYVYMNPSAEGVQRVSDDDWYGRTDLELFGADLAERRASADATIRRTGGSVVNTVEVDGRVWHTERFALPGSGGSVGVLGLDVTEQERAAESVRFQARLLENVRDAVIVVDQRGVTTYWNAGAEDILGYTAKEMIGTTMQPLVAPGTEADAASLWEAIKAGEIEALDWRGTRKDGSPVWLHIRLSPLTDEHGEMTAFLGVAKDVTARKEAELELARLGAAIEHATDGVIVTDAEDRVIYVNPAFERMTGFAGYEVTGRALPHFPAARAFAGALAMARRDRDDAWRGDVVARRRDGSDLICETTISPIVVEGQSGPGFVTIQRDVTRERAAEQAAERRARERALIAETLATLHASDNPDVTAASICRQLVKVPEVAIASIITFGPDGIATVLGQVHRSGAGRPGLDLDRARSDYLRQRAEAGPWVERWKVDAAHPYRELFAELAIEANAYAPILVDGRPIGVLVSGSDDDDDAVERMTERLPALVEFAGITASILAGVLAERHAAEAARSELRSIIATGAFVPVFQPIVELSTGKIRGYEALTRFADGATPGDRFELAARLGVGLELERACLAAAFEASTALPGSAWLNVNVSPDFVRAGLLGDLLPSGAREVVLEITEHEAIADYDTIREAIAPIHDRVSLAVDDAGAGFASLRHIVELAPALVKLDRSLIAGIEGDTAREAVVAGMVRFAQSAGHVLLAEGIETRQELATLRHLGVQLGQGYLLGPPLPVADEAERLAKAPSGRAARRRRSGGLAALVAAIVPS